MKNVVIFCVALILFAMASCQKEQDASPTLSSTEDVATTPQLKMSSSAILAATSASLIPSQMFAVDPMYKTSYIHVQQYSGECSWTSYALCTGAIARANGFTYPATHAKITAIKNACIAHAAQNGSSPSFIGNLDWYAGAYDYSIVNKQLRSTPKTSAGRFDMTKYMLAHINSYHTPFVALALDPQSNTGHYLTVWSINWIAGGTGSTLYYTNTLLTPQSTFNGNLKSTSLTTFLDWMRDNSQASYYNCLFLWNK